MAIQQHSPRKNLLQTKILWEISTKNILKPNIGPYIGFGYIRTKGKKNPYNYTSKSSAILLYTGASGKLAFSITKIFWIYIGTSVGHA